MTPAEPGKVQAQGTITFEDGTPVANARYTLLAPDGEFLHTDPAGKADLGERPAGPQRGRGIPNRAGADGGFSYPKETLEGVYILEILGLTAPQVARATDEAADDAIGNVVCFRLDAAPPTPTSAPVQEGLVTAPGPAAPGGKGGVVQSAPAPQTPVDPQLTAPATAVMVKRSYTSPGRLPITLHTSHHFRRDGTLTRSDTTTIKLFTARTGGSELQFNGTDNVFSGGRLSATGGVQLFAESATPSNTAGEYVLTLTLAAGSTPVGPPATLALTAVRLTLDLFASPASPNTAPVALPQPPNPAPAAGTATDKWFGGRTVSQQDAGGSQERAKLVVARAEPFDFAGNLVLRQVQVTGTTLGKPANRLRLFDNATPTAGETAHNNPFSFAAPGILGQTFFVEGTTLSGSPRDTGFELGIDGGEADGDRVALTVGVGATITIASAAPRGGGQEAEHQPGAPASHPADDQRRHRCGDPHPLGQHRRRPALRRPRQRQSDRLQRGEPGDDPGQRPGSRGAALCGGGGGERDSGRLPAHLDPRFRQSARRSAGDRQADRGRAHPERGPEPHRSGY